MDIEFDFKGDPVGGVITKCKPAYLFQDLLTVFLLHVILSLFLDLMAFCVQRCLITNFTHFCFRFAGKGNRKCLVIFFSYTFEFYIRCRYMYRL